MTALRAGFIGAGPRARGAHYPVVAGLDRVELVAACELDEALGRQVVTEHDISKLYSSHSEMLEREDLDLVYCIMNERLVLEPALDCLNSGRHILIEKPPGLDSGQTRKMLEAAESAGVWAMVGFQRRFAAVTQEAVRRVGARGRPTLAIGTFNKSQPDASHDVPTTLWSDVCHVVDLVRYMAGGEAAEVTAYRDRLRGEVFDHYTALVRFDNEATGCIFGHRASAAAYSASSCTGSTWAVMPGSPGFWKSTRVGSSSC